ncbi:MAG TPA: hypothetical protein VNN07_07310, partial [Candidatus Tectomicrobia bacterium]|nr:hypothetical protein [Candidatus Tectomicrobia bacterium]
MRAVTQGRGGSTPGEGEPPGATAPVALAIHPGALGDVLLAVPALRALRARGPERVVLAAQPRLGALLTTLGVVDGATTVEALALDALFVA